MNVRTLLARCALVAAGCYLPAAGFSQALFSRPLELVAHTGPGGGPDRVARVLAEIMMREKLVNQSVTVVNRVGGAGTVAYNYIKSKRGDPNVVLTGAGTSMLSATLRPEFGINLEDFTPLAMIAQDAQAVFVSAESPYKTLKDLIEAGRREPNALVASITSPTSSGRMLVWLIERETGARFKTVSMKSGSEAVTAVMGGHTQLSTENISEGIGQVEAKRVRVLAVSSAQRLPTLPDIPTLREAGYNVQVGTARGFVLPAGVPKDALDRLEAIFERIYNSAAWKAHAQASHYENSWMGSAEFGKYLSERRIVLQEFLQSIGAMKP